MPSADITMRRAGMRIVASLAAGLIAIVANVLALAAATLVPLQTAQGGLLRLFVSVTGLAVPQGGMAFQTGFHILVGLAMSVVYALILEPLLIGRAWWKGLQYAIIVWFANAALVLPLTCEGFAGSRHLTLAGMTWFAAAHTLFFVLLAILYSRFYKPHRLTD